MIKFSRWIIEKIGVPTAEMVLRSARKMLPETMALFEPRLYEETGRYHNPRKLIAGLVGSGASVKLFGVFPDAITELVYAALARLLEREVPTFFVAPELLQALHRTDLPVEEDWTRMHLPHDAAVFVFPRGVLRHPSGNEIEGIIYARLKKGERYSWPRTDKTDWPTVVEQTDRFIVATYIPNLFQAFVQNLTGDEMPFIPQNPDQIHGIDLEGVNITYLTEDDDFLKIDGDEKKMMNQLTSLTFSIILYMLARPEEIARGSLIKRARHRKAQGHSREFWTPNIIGFRYQRKRISEEMSGEKLTGRTVRPHWRRGHFRMQSYGPRRSERRVIWIEPTFVGGRFSESRNL